MKCNIWADCPKVPITELLSFIVDNRGKTVPTAPFGHKLIATNCVTNSTLFPVYERVRYLSEETYQTWFRAHPIPGDILFVNKGTPGRVCMVPDPVDFCIAQDMIALRVDDTKVYNKYLFGSTEYIVLASKGVVPPEYLYCLARYPAFVDYAVKNMNGSSGRQRVSAETIGQFRLSKLSDDDYTYFGKIVSPLFLKMRYNSLENMRLSALRDALLPKLMSGEIDVSDIQC